MKTATILITAALLAPATSFALDKNTEACFSHYNGQDYNNAIISGKNAVKTAVNSIESHVCFGVAYIQTGQVKLALEELKKAEELASSTAELSVVSSHLGIVYRRLGDNAKALQYYNRQLALCRELNLKEGISTALSNMADVYAAEGEYAKAAHYLSESLKITPDDPVTLSNMAVLLIHLKELDQAEKLMLRAIKAAEMAGDYHTVGRSLIELGAIRFGREDYKGAEATLFAGLEKVRAVGDLFWEGMGLQKLGWVYAKAGMRQKSIEHLKKAIALFDSIGAVDSVQAAERDLKEVTQDMI